MHATFDPKIFLKIVLRKIAEVFNRIVRIRVFTGKHQFGKGNRSERSFLLSAIQWNILAHVDALDSEYAILARGVPWASDRTS
jgi:hypothetical protein